MATKEYAIGSIKFDAIKGRVYGIVNVGDTWVDLGGEGSNAQQTAKVAPLSPLSCSKILSADTDVEAFCASIEAMVYTIQTVQTGTNKKMRCLVRSATFDVKGGSGAGKTGQGNQLVMAMVVVEALKQDS